MKYAPFFGSKTVAPSYLPSVVHALSSGMAYPISRAFPNRQEKHLICKQFNRNKYIVINDLEIDTQHRRGFFDGDGTVDIVSLQE